MRLTHGIVSGSDVTPAWQGHRDLEEQWRVYGVSSMFVDRDYWPVLPDWYDSLDPSHQYVGDIDEDLTSPTSI